MTSRERFLLWSLLLIGAHLGGCAGGPAYREVAGPMAGVSAKAALEAAERVLAERFPIESRDSEAMTIVTSPVIENVVPGTRLDRYRRKAHLEVVSRKGQVRVRIYVSLERASSETPIFYTGPSDPSWREIGRDVETEDAIGREIQALLSKAKSAD